MIIDERKNSEKIFIVYKKFKFIYPTSAISISFSSQNLKRKRVILWSLYIFFVCFHKKSQRGASAPLCDFILFYFFGNYKILILLGYRLLVFGTKLVPLFVPVEPCGVIDTLIMEITY